MLPAVAVSATATPRVTPAPAVGAVSATTGAAVTVTFTLAEVTVVPLESVTRAVSAVPVGCARSTQRLRLNAAASHSAA